MHIIKVKHTVKIVLSQKSTDLEGVISALREAEENRAKIIAGASSVEKTLTEIISHFFSPNDEDARKNLKELIIDSDWCSFGNKRKVVEKIISKKSLLDEKKLSEYRKLLADTMEYRNAFAHGQFIVSQQGISLAYYKDGARSPVLSDDYLKKIEVTLNETNKISMHLALALGLKDIISYESEETR
jgi:hypothetical protein